VRFGDYARASVQEVFANLPTGEVGRLQHAKRLEASTLATTYFENKGGKFVAHELPAAAQVAPCHGIATSDFNGDGKTDLLLVGNFSGMDTETGRLDASNGCILLGDGKGGFKVGSTDLGISGEARGLTPVRLPGGKVGWLVANNNGPVQLVE
jgi:hypothetical protein